MKLASSEVAKRVPFMSNSFLDSVCPNGRHNVTQRSWPVFRPLQEVRSHDIAIRTP